MAKRIEIDGKFYRYRRGKLVQIPDEWVGNTVYDQTKRKRPAHFIHKLKKALKDRIWKQPKHDPRKEPIGEDDE
jgi:hypothetical protein